MFPMRIVLSTLVLTSLVAAGCVTPPEELEGAALDPTAALGAATESPYTFEGDIGLNVGACPMVVPCVWQSPMGEASGEAIEIAGVLTAANLTMTWEAEDPSSESMYFGLWWGAEGEEGTSEYVSGASPLVLELTNLDIPEDNEVWVFAWPASPIPLGIVQITTPQAFTVEGTLTTMDAPVK